MGKIIDLTFDIESNMPTCGTAWHEQVMIKSMGSIPSVGRNTSSILLGSHSGTHIDAPLHFIDFGDDITKLDLEILCGPVRIVDFTHVKAGEVVRRSDVEKISVSERMIFRFDWFKNWKTDSYYKIFPYFDLDAIEYLYNNGMRLMAMDTPSPDYGGAINSITLDDSPNHKYLLRHGVIIVEYLNHTDKIDMDKNYEIIALPLKVSGSDGAPGRVIVKEVNG